MAGEAGPRARGDEGGVVIHRQQHIGGAHGHRQCCDDRTPERTRALGCVGRADDQNNHGDETQEQRRKIKHHRNLQEID